MKIAKVLLAVGISLFISHSAWANDKYTTINNNNESSMSNVSSTDNANSTNNENLSTIANSQLLPSPFPVYTNGTVVINHPIPGFTRKDLPTINDYQGSPGCYIACFSHNNQNAIYSVGPDIYVMGQIRVPGHYVDRRCLPEGFTSTAISGESQFKTLCQKKIPHCGKDCWGGSDTGGWFGIQ